MQWDAPNSTGLVTRRGILFHCERGERDISGSVQQAAASTAISLLPPDLMDPILWAQIINEFMCAVVSCKVVLCKCL